MNCLVSYSDSKIVKAVLKLSGARVEDGVAVAIPFL